MTSFLRFPCFIVLTLGGLVGCTREAGPSNGESGALEMGVEGLVLGPSDVLATGIALDVSVSRYDDYWRCPDLSKSLPPGATHTADVRAQSCGASPEPISLIDAHCDDGACTIEPKADDSGAVRLVVTGTRDGAATLHVDVKSTTSDATWGDSFALRFSTATRIAVESSAADTGNTEYASMPGAVFTWCPELHDANETHLVAPQSAIAISVGGDSSAVSLGDASTSYQPPGCAAFTASQPGTATIDFSAQSLTATGSVRVADPNDIVGASLYAFDDAGDTGAAQTDPRANEIGRAPKLMTSPLTSLDLTLEDSFVDFASVLTLKDGSLALGGAGRYQSSSEEALSVGPEDASTPAIAAQYLSVMPMGNVIGDGTVDATFGAVKVSIPFHITR